MSLSAILNNFEIIFCSKRHDRIHIARPAGKVHTDHSSGTFRQYGTNRLGCNILRVTIYIGKHRHGPRIDDGRNRGKECTRGDDYFIS
ncbi:hypothetical protein D3C76_1532100 [compost metagenome]